MNPEVEPTDDNQPVAYDTEGRPLYHRPENKPAETQPQTINATAPEQPQPLQQPVEPPSQSSRRSKTLPPGLQLKHDESAVTYDWLGLSDTEYVVIDVERSIWGLIEIWAVALLAFVAVLAATILMTQLNDDMGYGAVVGLVASGGCFVGGMIGTYVFRQNYFIVTNERVFAKIQSTPVAQHSQNLELEHVEDCSYTQNGVFQTLFNYGSIRLSTVGDEHIYKFNFVDDPATQFAVINKVVQAVDESEPTRYND